MATQQQVHNLKLDSVEVHKQVCEQLLVSIAEATDANGINVDSTNAESTTTANRKKKIVLIGPEIDRLASHVRWGKRLSSSFYRTIGLNVSLRTVTTKTPVADVDIDFVVWQLSPNLDPNLLKNFMRGASALIIAVGATGATGDTGADATSTGDTSNNNPESQESSQTVDDAGAAHYYVEEESDYSWSEADAIAMLDESANQLKLPIAFIHFVENKTNTLSSNSVDNQQELQKHSYSSESPTDNCIVKLHETEHSLHLGLMSAEESEICLCKAFDYIAEHFAYTI